MFMFSLYRTMNDWNWSLIIFTVHYVKLYSERIRRCDNILDVVSYVMEAVANEWLNRYMTSSDYAALRNFILSRSDELLSHISTFSQTKKKYSQMVYSYDNHDKFCERVRWEVRFCITQDDYINLRDEIASQIESVYDPNDYTLDS